MAVLTIKNFPDGLYSGAIGSLLRKCRLDKLCAPMADVTDRPRLFLDFHEVDFQHSGT
jgi:hypothetical protein